MIIDGKAIAEQIQNEIKTQVSQIAGRKPCLAVILVGENAASKIYTGRKSQACTNVGMLSVRREFPDSITQEELLREVQKLNDDPTVDGILVQLPLPKQINPLKITLAIDPAKDVDGFHPLNVGKLLTGETDGFFPCTPYGIKTLLERSGVEIAGKHVLVIGRSNIVGKPMAALLMQNTPDANATVTIAHSRTKNIKELCLLADIIIVAIGKAHFVTADMVKGGAVLIDVGMNKIPSHDKKEGYQLVGDADFENLKDKCSVISPVPGGVGPMTIAMLISNTWKSYRQHLLPILLAMVMMHLATACNPGPAKDTPPTSTVTMTDNKMTIDYRITLPTADYLQKKEQIHQIVDSVFEEIDTTYNKWNPHSELSRLNNAKANTPLPLSQQLEQFLKDTGTIVAMTDGRFDPTIEPLQRVWKKAMEQGREPSQADIAAITPAVGWHHIHFGNGTFTKDHDGTMLDLGGIAKGLAVDMLTERLHEAGIPDLYVEWGGEIRATGQHPDGRPWNIFISRLDNTDPEQAIAHVSLHDQAIATSGDYLQFWTVGDKRYFHIIDPATHAPLVATATSVASASVLAPTCVLADGLATGLMTFSTVAEAQQWAEKIRVQNPDIAFWVVSRTLEES